MRIDINIIAPVGLERLCGQVFDVLRDEYHVPFGAGLVDTVRDDSAGVASIGETNMDICKVFGEVSSRFPDIIIQVDADDDDDKWKARFMNGKKEVVEVKEYCPPFRKIVLPADTGARQLPERITVNGISYVRVDALRRFVNAVRFDFDASGNGSAQIVASVVCDRIEFDFLGKQQ